MLNQGSTGPSPLLDKDMKKTLSLSAALLMSTTSVFAQDAILLDEIVVNGNLTGTEFWKTGSSRNTLNSNDLSETTSSSLADLLKIIPGVTTTQSGSYGGTAYLTLRGLPSAYVKTIKDGIDITDPSAIKTEFGDLGEVAVQGISSLEILKGTQSAIYGSSAVAGVMSFASINLNNAIDGRSQMIDLNYGSNNTFSGRYQYTNVVDGLKLGISTSTYSTDGVSSASTNEIDPYTSKNNYEKDKFDGQSVAVAVLAELSENLEMGANFFVEKSLADYDESDGTIPYDGTQDETKKREATGAIIFANYHVGNWQHKISTSKYVIDRTLTSPTQGFYSSPSKDTYRGERLQTQYVATADISRNFNLSFGLDTETENVNANSLQSGKQGVTTTGLFAEGQLLLSDNFAIMGNFRHDDHEKFGGFDSYRLSASFKIAPTTVFRAQHSTGFRAPSTEELFSYYPVWNSFGNPNLKPETFETNEVSLNHNIGEQGVLSLSIFETTFKDRIEYQGNSYVNGTDKAHVSGSEIALQAPLDGSTKVGFSITNLKKNNIKGDRSAGQTVNISFSHKFNDAISAKLDMISVSDQPAKGTWQRSDYNLVNISASYALTKTLNMYGRVENLADLQYQTERNYSAPGRTVTVGLSANF